MTIRLRLTLLYGALFLVAGVALLTITYLFVAHSPWPREPEAPDAPTVDLPGDGPLVDAPTVEEPAPPTLSDEGAEVSDARRDDDLDRLMVGSSLALGAMATASAGLGWLVAGRVLRPLSTMTARARRISAENLHERLDASGPDDELKALADTLDDLLSRLDAAFESQRRFVANASHELRTPLTVQRTLVEVALADPDAGVEALRATGHQVLRGVEDQERLIDALLVLARSQRGVAWRSPVDLADLVDRSLDDRRDDIAGRRLQVTARLDPAVAAGDPELLERLVTNLLDNAIVHNVDGGRIDLATGSTGGRAILRIANGGPTVTPERITTLREPFHSDRTHPTSRQGLGLGLSIVDAITRAHGGLLDIQPGPDGGLAITVALPLPVTAPPGAGP